MELETYLKVLDNRTEFMVNRIIQWSNINSHTFNVTGLERMASVLTQAFSELECEGDIYSLTPIERVDSSGEIQSVNLGPLLRFWKRPDAPIQVLLVGHMDTVYGVEHYFQEAHRESEDILVGPGVADMKGGLCIMLEALKAFEKCDTAQNLGWEILINSDEEIGSLGSGPFLEEHAKAHRVGLLFEPAMDEKGTLAGERKGSGKFDIIVHGRAAHAGRDFDKGRNAITALSRIIAKIDALNGMKEGVTLNVGEVQGGGSVNVVPELAFCRIDVRFLEKSHEAWVQDNLEAMVKEENKHEGIKVILKGGFTRRPKKLVGKTQAFYEFVKEVGQELDQDISWKPSGGCSDGNNLAYAGLPNIDSLGICGGKIHSAQEFLQVDCLVPRAKLTAAILIRLSERKF